MTLGAIGPGLHVMTEDWHYDRVTNVDPTAVITMNGFRIFVSDVTTSDMEGLEAALRRGRCDVMKFPGPPAGARDTDVKWIASQRFEVGDIVTYQPHPDAREDPLFRVITAVRDSGYSWEYLDRGINHGHQTRADEDYLSENSSDPMLWYWRRVLKGASR